jgi:16S rRNA (adenine1518-N6/adenine1519-N6)-dimethyltransferase
VSKSGPRARKRYGQHFLEPAWADKLVAAIAPAAADRFLEIGPGPGALTSRLAPLVDHLTAVEIDPAMVALLQGGTARHSLAPRSGLPSNVVVVRADFLDFDVQALTARGPIRVAGNLPYNASSPILFKLLDDYRTTGRIVDATLMLQREVADRIAAAPGGREYGVLSIFVQRVAGVRRLLTLPPGAFRPAPKVHSAVIRLTFHPPQEAVGDERTFEGLVRSIFTQRRKTLLNALRPFAAARGVDPAAVLGSASIDSGRRPETLTIAELVRLSDCVSSYPSRA